MREEGRGSLDSRWRDSEDAQQRSQAEQPSSPHQQQGRSRTPLDPLERWKTRNAVERSATHPHAAAKQHQHVVRRPAVVGHQGASGGGLGANGASHPHRGGAAEPQVLHHTLSVQGLGRREVEGWGQKEGG